MGKKQCLLTSELIKRYAAYLGEEERSPAMVGKYVRDLTALQTFLGGRPLSKMNLIEWKQQLTQTYASASVNSMLAAANSFLAFMNRKDLAVKPLKLQKPLFLAEEKELTKDEYIRLVRVAQQENERLALVIQTICATGIRVSELRYITAEAVCSGRAEVNNKGKRRPVFLPEQLRCLLKQYLKKQKKTSGPVFTTRSGNPLDRSNVWREMKALCEKAGIAPEKAFPHNLRHLFARTYYSRERDLSRLADLLGHSSINTTRIYTAESGRTHARQVESMGLIIT